MDVNIEESTSLAPRSGNSGSEKSPRRMLHFNREKRIRLIRLEPIYYVSWILLIILSALIMPYLNYLMPEPECWQSRKTQITVSSIIGVLTAVLSLLLLIIQCMTRVKTTPHRRDFCRFSFFLFTLFSIVHFAISIYFFSMFSCYFDQSTPDEVISDENSWLTNLSNKYDLKIVAIVHLICSLLAFFTGIGYAIIKNNFKYVLRVDIN